MDGRFRLLGEELALIIIMRHTAAACMPQSQAAEAKTVAAE